jgi:hypothetical protein
MAQRQIGMDTVVVLPADLVLRKMPASDQISNDALCGAPGDAGLLGNVLQADAGIRGDIQKHMAVVGQKLPTL